MGESEDRLFPYSARCFGLVLEKSVHAIQIARTFGIYALNFGFCLNISKSYVYYFIFCITCLNFSVYVTAIIYKSSFFYYIFSAFGILDTRFWYAIYAITGWYSTRCILCDIVIILACVCRWTFNGEENLAIIRNFYCHNYYIRNNLYFFFCFMYASYSSLDSGELFLSITTNLYFHIAERYWVW